MCVHATGSIVHVLQRCVCGGKWIDDVEPHDGGCFKRALGGISKPLALMSMNGGIGQRNLGRGKDDVRCRPADIRVTQLEQTATRL